MNKKHSNVLGTQNVESDHVFLLPSDDQLDYFVDKLCESVPTMNINPEIQEVESNKSANENVDEKISNHTFVEFPGSSDDEKCIKFTNVKSSLASSSFKSDNQQYDCKLSKQFHEKRSLFNNELNIAILQCSGSLEFLVEKRKSLELLVQMQHSVANINYNFSYSPRLPDAPTRVDRLMYDINKERCRILGLMSVLEKTINLFSSKNTKENLRKLLISFGNAIVDVMKERQSEVALTQAGSTSNDYEIGVRKLVKLIGRVNSMNRAVYTALWCIEIKEQVGIVIAKKNMRKLQSQTQQKQMGITIQKSWQYVKTSPTSSKTSSSSSDSSPRSASTSHKSIQQPVWVAQQQTSIYQIVPQHKQTNRKSTAMQLFAQEQRAEIFQHFYSTLKQSS